MQILSGCMVGIRNPRAHKHDWEDTEKKALQLLIIADHLILRIKESEKVSHRMQHSLPKDRVHTVLPTLSATL